MELPEDRLYSEYHLWITANEKPATVGVTAYAVEELGSIDYVELPQEGEGIVKGQPFGTVETSKAVTDLTSPVSGKVVEINDALAETPQDITEEPYGKGWLIKVKPSDPREMDQLMKAEEYGPLVASQTLE